MNGTCLLLYPSWPPVPPVAPVPAIPNDLLTRATYYSASASHIIRQHWDGHREQTLWTLNTVQWTDSKEKLSDWGKLQNWQKWLNCSWGFLVGVWHCVTVTGKCERELPWKMWFSPKPPWKLEEKWVLGRVWQDRGRVFWWSSSFSLVSPFTRSLKGGGRKRWMKEEW